MAAMSPSSIKDVKLYHGEIYTTGFPDNDYRLFIEYFVLRTFILTSGF